jgi:hypothetical protein
MVAAVRIVFRLFRFLSWAVLVVLGIGIGTALAARLCDGPLLMFPGGPLHGGELVLDPGSDFGFAADIPEIELQTGGSSRTVWVLVYNGELYIPASTSFPPFKRWHQRALEQPQALLRIAGKRYPGELERVEDPALRAALGSVATAKYPLPPGTSSLDQVWFFHFHPARQG